MAKIHHVKNILWKLAGFILLGIAYVGVILPGLPFSPFLVGAAICFSKGSPAMHAWIFNHRFFGPFLTNWTSKRVFPIKLKYAMLLVMLSSLGVMWASGIILKYLIISAVCMTCVAIWAWRYPSSVEDYNTRIQAGKRIGWIK